VTFNVTVAGYKHHVGAWETHLTVIRHEPTPTGPLRAAVAEGMKVELARMPIVDTVVIGKRYCCRIVSVSSTPR
jgi:hypothetical protein